MLTSARWRLLLRWLVSPAGPWSPRDRATLAVLTLWQAAGMLATLEPRGPAPAVTARQLAWARAAIEADRWAQVRWREALAAAGWVEHPVKPA